VSEYIWSEMFHEVARVSIGCSAEFTVNNNGYEGLAVLSNEARVESLTDVPD